MTRADYAYQWVDAGHPLGRPTKRSKVGKHRLALWVHLGSLDTAACSWCGWTLPWKAENSLRCVNTDHLNRVTRDNRVENLTPACSWCNRARAWVPPLIGEDRWEIVLRMVGAVAPWDRPAAAWVVAILLGIPLADAEELGRTTFAGYDTEVR